MPKRPNEDSQSEPVAKRSAAESQQDLLLRAQASLDRLDFKTAEELCSDVINSGGDEIVQPLMVRSSSLGKRGRFCESLQDAERALKSKKSLETHLRAAFSYLGMVQHHLNLAKKFSDQSSGLGIRQEKNDDALLSKNIIELEESIQEARNLEKRGSFKQVSPELFTKIVSFCDSPSLAMAEATCKSWKDLITNDTEFFRSFTMRGKARNIVDGLWRHGVQCKHSIHSVNLEVTDQFDEIEKNDFDSCLSRSKDTLRSIQVSHSGDLGADVWTVAQKCNRLSVLSSTLLEPLADQNLPILQNPVALGADPTWQAQLDKLVWTDDSVSLVCDDALLSRLGQAKVVELGKACTVNQVWIIELLSSSAGQSLVKVKIPSVLTQTELEFTIPNLHLPKLELLFLGKVPLKGEDADEESFFEKLKAPKLVEFGLGHLDILGTLSGLKCKQITSLEIGLEPESDYDGQMVAYDLVWAIKTWGNLEEIHLQLEGRESSNFCNHFSALITPLSSTSIEHGFKDRLVFPNLKRIAFSRRLGGGGTHELLASANILGCLVASRKAVARRVSPENVLWAASNQYEACQEPAAQRNVIFSSSEAQICSVMESVDISQTDREYGGTHRFENALKWLEENLKEFKHPYINRDL